MTDVSNPSAGTIPAANAGTLTLPQGTTANTATSTPQTPSAKSSLTPDAPGNEQTAAASKMTEQERAEMLPPDWAKNWTEDDIRQWVARGRQDPNALWNSYKHAQKALTASDRVALPKEGDPASEALFRKALGVPDKPDGYTIEVPKEGGDAALADTFRKTAHELGLTPKQVTALNTMFNTHIAAAQAAQAGKTDEEFTAQANRDTAALRSEWGTTYNQRFEAAMRTASALGLTAEEAVAMESVLGTKRMITAFSTVGQALGERGFVAPDDNTTGINSIESAQEAINEIKSDPKRMEALSRDLRNPSVTSKDKTTWEKAHQRIAAGGR